MKIVFFDDFRLGLLRGQEVIDADETAAAVGGGNPQEVLQNLITSFSRVRPALDRLHATGRGVPLGKVRLRQPVPRPRKVFCCIGNYKEGVDREVRPIDLFMKSSDSIVGPGDTVVLPARQHPIFHHEAELGIVIGADAHNVNAREAMGHVFGYVAFVDVSGRGAIGRQESGSFLGKSYDTFGPIGPCITTADEVGDPHKLSVKLWVDGQIRHDYNTDDMEHQVPEIIEFASSIATLLPGDIIACGTNHQGLGPLQDGDTGEIEVERVGRFSFQVSDALKRVWPKMVDVEAAQLVRAGASPLGSQRPQA
ncbi:MAG: fumarylacetoacetate hydrolase family protein [Chloroflexi bacterium]|nr:fumarylacetoacetate hydrolase family protein [Chloroflexota bacterium]